jgi:hypothetical protein
MILVKHLVGRKISNLICAGAKRPHISNSKSSLLFEQYLIFYFTAAAIMVRTRATVVILLMYSSGS